jgi:hypothetical protein
MTRITTYLSMLTLKVNGLNSPIKRYHLGNWIKKEDPTVSYRRLTSSSETSTGEGERLENLPSQ